MNENKESVQPLDEVLNLSSKIQYKSLINQAISRAIGAIHEQYEGVPPENLNNDSNIFYVPYLSNLSMEIAKEIDEMSEKIQTLLIEIKNK